MKPIAFGALIRRITLNMNLFLSIKLENFGMKQGQLDYFMLIYTNPGINQLELARLNNVGKASVTKALKILEEDGYIKRMTDASDKRNILCYVSESGNTIGKNLLEIQEIANVEVFKGFTSEEKLQFFSYLQRMSANAEELASAVKGGDKNEISASN